MATSYVLEERVDRLEEAMAEMAREVALASRAAAEASLAAAEASQAAREASRVAAQTSRELAEFKDEMQEFKEEMSDFKDEMREFKDEMSDFKVEMQEFKEESRLSRIDMNRRWGELSNKLGTMAEDLVAPSIPRILRTVLGCPDNAIELTAVRMRRRSSVDPNRRREFDVIASCGDYLLVNETKSRLSPQDVTDFADMLPSVREFFPEMAEQKIVGVIASLYVDESLVRFAERRGLIILGFGEDVMDVLNSPDFSPQFF